MKLQFSLTFKQGTKTVAEVQGREIEAANLTVEQLNHHVLAVEQLSEKLTGLRCHVNCDIIGDHEVIHRIKETK